MARSQPGEMQARRSRRYLLSSRAALCHVFRRSSLGRSGNAVRARASSCAVRRCEKRRRGRRVRGLARRALQRLSKSMGEGGCASQVGGCELTLKVEVEAARLAVEMSSQHSRDGGTRKLARWSLYAEQPCRHRRAGAGEQKARSQQPSVSVRAVSLELQLR
jgi:hypothetical protein